jgi:Flp pilus assembly protein TadG
MSKNSSGNGRNRQRGAILYIVAAGLVVLIGFAGLAIDLGMLYNVKTDLQNATDAAALAGAWQLNGTPTGINNAVTSAINAANKFYFNNNPVGVVDGDVTFSTQMDSGFMSSAAAADPAVAPTIKYVKVTKTRTMDLSLLKIIPGVASTQNVAANAVAGQSPPLNNICDGLIPLSPVPQAGSGAMEIYTPGYYYTYRMAPNNDVSDVGAGNYLILDFCPALGTQNIACNSGGATVRDLLSGATQGCIPLDTPICTKPGVSAGPVRQGLNDRFYQDANQTEYTCGTGCTNQYDLYVAAGGTGQRKVMVPFVSTTPDVWTPLTPGKNCPVYVLNYGCFFMREQVPGGNGGDIKGEFIGKCTANGYFDPNATPPPSLGLPSITKLVIQR